MVSRVHGMVLIALVAGLLSGPGIDSGAAVRLSSTASPAPTERDTLAGSQARGEWNVVTEGNATWRVMWRSPTRLPLRSDRPVFVSDEAVLGAPAMGSDGRTLSLRVRSTSKPDPANLGVVLSGDRLDITGREFRGRAATGQAARTFVPKKTVLPADPATPGPYPITTSDYTRPAVKLPGMPEPIEMVGHVVEPRASADTGPRPLVLFLHGRHETC